MTRLIKDEATKPCASGISRKLFSSAFFSYFFLLTLFEQQVLGADLLLEQGARPTQGCQGGFLLGATLRMHEGNQAARDKGKSNESRAEDNAGISVEDLDVVRIEPVAEPALAAKDEGKDKTADDARRFLARYPAEFTTVLDTAGACPAAYRLKAMPSSYLIGRDGTVLATLVGFHDRDKADLRQRLLDALSEGRSMPALRCRCLICSAPLPPR